jgi:hypothetical protein
MTTAERTASHVANFARADRAFVVFLRRTMAEAIAKNPNDRQTAIWLQEVEDHLRDFPTPAPEPEPEARP